MHFRSDNEYIENQSSFQFNEFNLHDYSGSLTTIVEEVESDLPRFLEPQFSFQRPRLSFLISEPSFQLSESELYFQEMNHIHSSEIFPSQSTANQEPPVIEQTIQTDVARTGEGKISSQISYARRPVSSLNQEELKRHIPF